MEQLGPIGQIFKEFDIWIFKKKNIRERISFIKLTRKKGTLREGLQTFIITSLGIFLELEIFQTKKLLRK